MEARTWQVSGLNSTHQRVLQANWEGAGCFLSCLIMGGWDEGGGGELLTALDFTRENLTLFSWTQAPSRELISHTCLAS